MKKTRILSWKKYVRLTILSVLCYGIPVALAAEAVTLQKPSDHNMVLKEAQVARQAAEGKNAELSAALIRTELELQALRRRYAEIYLASRAAQDELEDYELRVAGLLADREEPTSGRALPRVLAALDKLQSNQQDLRDQVKEFGAYLNSVLDVLQPSEAMRREVTTRFAQLEEVSESSAGPRPIVARRGRGSVERPACRILAVSDELQTVVLNRGFNDGVRQGMTWRVVSGDDILARMKVIEVRAAISAAVVTDGKFKAVGPGAEARLGD